MVAAIQQEKRQRWTKKRALESEPQWSEHQRAIFEWVENGSGNLRIDAAAGSGKTICLSAIVTRLPSDSKACILAFNKHIVEAMSAKVPTRVGVFTAHAYGYGMLSREFSGPPEVDETKYRRIGRDLVLSKVEIDDLVRALMAELARAGKKADSKQCKRMVVNRLNGFLNLLIRGCQSTLIEPSVDELVKMINFFGLDVPVGGDRVLPLVKDVLRSGVKLALSQGVIDFGDMLWLPHFLDLQSAAKDWVLVDEAQDANRAQLSLYKRLSKNARVVFVGDQAQSIMGFSFADPAMWDVAQKEFSAQTLPLSVCYRCPKSHLDLARYFKSGIQPSPTAVDGILEVMHPDRIKSEVKSGDLILCRFTAPLITLCLELIVKGRNARVRGRDLGALMVSMIEQVDQSRWGDFLAALGEVIAPQLEKLRDALKDEQADALSDRLLAVKACHDEFGAECSTLSQFVRKVESLFSDDSTEITLSTIHRAKGDEADRVFLLGCNSLPYEPRNARDWQLEQERNIAYVALTRAKKELYLCPMGEDDRVTEALVKQPYGGMNVQPVLLQSQTESDVVDSVTETNADPVLDLKIDILPAPVPAPAPIRLPRQPSQYRLPKGVIPGLDACMDGNRQWVNAGTAKYQELIGGN